MAEKHNGIRSASPQGFTLLETLIATALLAIGVMGLAMLIPTATRNDYRSRIDTTATFVAMQELEQIMAQPYNSTSFVDAEDGNGDTVTVNVSCTPAPCEDGADLLNGNIDFAGQAAAAVPAGFRRDYVIAQSATDDVPKVNQGTYDVRWHISINVNEVKTIVVAARPVGDQPGITSIPVNLRATQMR